MAPKPFLLEGAVFGCGRGQAHKGLKSVHVSAKDVFRGYQAVYNLCIQHPLTLRTELVVSWIEGKSTICIVNCGIYLLIGKKL